MPRLLDVESRDRVVVEAAWRVIERSGLPALSVRTLAAEAGLPPSSLRTTFPTQAQARRAALLEALRQQERRIAAAADPRSLLLALLPLGPAARTEGAVLLALRTAAPGDPDLEALRQEADEAVLRACEEAVRAQGGDDLLLVRLLHALVDGLALRLLHDQDAEGDAARAVDRLLAVVAGATADGAAR